MASEVCKRGNEGCFGGDERCFAGERGSGGGCAVPARRYLWALIAAYVLLIFVPLLLLLLLIPLFYNFLFYINKPTTGTVGTFSLLVALGSFFLQRWDSIVRLWCRFIECG